MANEIADRRAELVRMCARAKSEEAKAFLRRSIAELDAVGTDPATRPLPPLRRAYNPYEDEDCTLCDDGAADLNPDDPEYDPWVKVRRALNVVSADALREAGKTVRGSSPDDEPITAPDLSAALTALHNVPRAALSGMEHGVVYMRYFDGLSYREIAEECGLSGPAQAKKIEQRALQKLQKCLARVGVNSLVAKKSDGV
jgi:hypothetical protein